jgi:hypothetical protein
LTNHWVIGTVVSVLAAGILVGIRASHKKHLEQSQGSPDPVQQEQPEAKARPQPANVAVAPDKEKKPAKEQPLTERQKAAAADAIKALARIEAAVQVGVIYQQYGQQVIDAKAVVNETARVLPQGEMLTNLSNCMDAYRDAGSVWNFKIQFPTLALMKELGHGEIIERYKLPLRTVKRKNEEIASPDEAMQIMWRVGAEKLAKARSLLQG